MAKGLCHRGPGDPMANGLCHSWPPTGWNPLAQLKAPPVCCPRVRPFHSHAPRTWIQWPSPTLHPPEAPSFPCGQPES